LRPGEASAIDCRRARTDTERAICGDAVTLAADSALGEAFERLRGGTRDDDARRGLSRSHIERIMSCDGICLRHSQTPLPRCLAEESSKRQRVVEGGLEDGGTGLFRPGLIDRPATGNIAQIFLAAIGFTVPAPGRRWRTPTSRRPSRTQSTRRPWGRPGGSARSLRRTVRFAAARDAAARLGTAACINDLGRSHPGNWERNISIELALARRFGDRVNATEAAELFRLMPPAGRAGAIGNQRRAG
jgi:uncharacterized protein YecT (DUF1311 family)